MERERERDSSLPCGVFLNLPSSECSRLSPVPRGCTAVHNITTRGNRVGTLVVQLDSVREHFILRLVWKRIVAICFLLLQPYRMILCILSILNSFFFRTRMKTEGIVSTRPSSLNTYQSNNPPLNATGVVRPHKKQMVLQYQTGSFFFSVFFFVCVNKIGIVNTVCYICIIHAFTTYFFCTEFFGPTQVLLIYILGQYFWVLHLF